MFEARYLGQRRRRPTTCLGDVGELTAPKLSRFDEIMPVDHPMRLLPRKWWEWDYIADCAESLGLLNPNAKALGLGVGWEPLIFYFSNHCEKVIATDLYSADTAWREARFSETDRILDSSPIDYPRARVEVRNADMRATGAESNSIDFVWSCSSIEHVPTLIDLYSVFAEIDRVLKVGGCAILTTEYCLTENPYLMPGVNAWNREIFDVIVASLPGYEWLGTTDLSFNALHPGNGARPRRYMPVSALPASSKHLSFYHRAGTLANPVGLSVIAPIGFVIRKVSSEGIVPFEEAKLPERLRTFSLGIQAFFAGDNDEAVIKLETVYRDSADDMQLRHLAFRFMIDARARRGEMQSRDEFVARIKEFLALLPSGPVQDADCLDLCGYLLGECDFVEEALSVYERCLLSPSTSKPHVFELAVRYLELASRQADSSASEDLVASLLADLLQFGASGHDLEQAVFVENAKLPDEVLKSVRNKMCRHLDLAIKGLRL